MPTEINVPTLGESVTSATVARWMKHEGDVVAADEPLVELETDKVTVEVSAPFSGVLNSIVAQEGSEVPVGALLALLEAGAALSAPARLVQAQPVAACRRQPTGRRASAAASARTRDASGQPAATGAGAAGRRQTDRGAASVAGADRSRHRQGRPHHQG
jgi:2-oxoglutarate dehydrogenase E2 component (dihydrolipoamide succinyltransferase)